MLHMVRMLVSQIAPAIVTGITQAMEKYMADAKRRCELTDAKIDRMDRELDETRQDITAVRQELAEARRRVEREATRTPSTATRRSRSRSSSTQAVPTLIAWTRAGPHAQTTVHRVCPDNARPSRPASRGL